MTNEKTNYELENIIPMFPFQPHLLNMIEGKNHKYKLFELTQQLEKEFIEWSYEVQKFSESFKTKTICNSIDILENLIEFEKGSKKELYETYKAKVIALEATSNEFKPTLTTIWGSDIDKLTNAHEALNTAKYIKPDIDSWLYLFGGVPAMKTKPIEWKKSIPELLFVMEIMCPDDFSKTGDRKIKQLNEVFKAEKPVEGYNKTTTDTTKRKSIKNILTAV